MPVDHVSHLGVVVAVEIVAVEEVVGIVAAVAVDVVAVEEVVGVVAAVSTVGGSCWSVCTNAISMGLSYAA